MNARPDTHTTDDRSVLILPPLREAADLDIELLREPGERFFRTLLLLLGAVLSAVAFAGITMLVITDPAAGLLVVGYLFLFTVPVWLALKLFAAYLEGNSVRVGPSQYPVVYDIVRQAAEQLAVPVPNVYIMQGSGLLDILVSKHFTRRGFIIVTSDLMDALLESATTRELMMLVGRQLGHLKAGHFRYWLLKDMVGQITWLVHKAYWRRCHLTADRIGLIVAGDLYAAEQSLLLLTVGPKLAPHTNMDEIDLQAERLQEQFWPRLFRLLSEYPHMVERVSRLRELASRVQRLRHQAGNRPPVGALPIRHLRLKTLPVMMVHGHDHSALLEVKDFLRSRYPYIDPVVMSVEMLGATAMPEKFERLAAQACGAIAILSPDDLASSARLTGGPSSLRARQNVILEIGWFWGRLGRGRCLLLSQGKVEIPSDLAGVECLEYIRTPREHFESVRDFISQLEHLESGAVPSAARPGRGTPPVTVTAASDPGVSTRCAHCDAVVFANSRFCEECGAASTASRAM